MPQKMLTFYELDLGLNHITRKFAEPVPIMFSFVILDAEPIFTSAFFVDPSSEPGSHWLAVARQPGERDLLFDTFARAPSANFIPHMRGMALTEPDVDQEMYSTRCGQLCMGFGHVFINHGYDAAKLC